MTTTIRNKKNKSVISIDYRFDWNWCNRGTINNPYINIKHRTIRLLDYEYVAGTSYIGLLNLPLSHPYMKDNLLYSQNLVQSFLNNIDRHLDESHEKGNK